MPAKRAVDARLWWTVAALVVAAGIVAAILLGGGDQSSVENAANSEDGIQFEVRSSECGLSSLSVASGAAAEPENGTFCLVRPLVRNLTEVQRRLEASCQFLIDQSGERYPPRQDIAALRETAGGLFKEGLGPLEVTSEFLSLYYDVSKGTEVSAVEFHASCGSPGVRIEVPA